MNQPLEFPKNYYESLPHLRLSKKKYLAIENDLLYLVKIHSDQSIFTQLYHCSEIQKVTVQMQRSKNGSYLSMYLLLRMGKKKGFFIRPRKFGYSQVDWIQIPEFFRAIGFRSEILPVDKIGLEDIDKGWQVRGPYRYFSSDDKIFALFENPEFVEELKLIHLSPFAIMLIVIGAICLFPAIMFGLIPITPKNILFWVFSGISVLSLVTGISKLKKYSQIKKAFAAKYDISYYF